MVRAATSGNPRRRYGIPRMRARWGTGLDSDCEQGCGTKPALGRRDRARELPRFRRADPGPGRALARADQGRGGPGQRADLELLDADIAERIASAADRVAAGEFDDQFPIDVFQTGSGTSSNMNANEVIAALAGDDVHANDHVNMGRSNDVFPSAVHLAALGEIAHDLLPALERLAASLERKAFEFDDVVKSGRTHLMDAVPVTLGQEFTGYATQVRRGSPASRTRCRASGRSARWDGDGHRPQHSRVRRARP